MPSGVGGLVIASVGLRSDPRRPSDVKTVIKDREAILVPSANLIGAAMDRNMELGLPTEGVMLPTRSIVTSKH